MRKVKTEPAVFPRGVREWRRLLATETCPVCGEHVPERHRTFHAGHVLEPGRIYHAGLEAYLHPGECEETAYALARDYRKSRKGRKGRWRTLTAWRRLIDAAYLGGEVATRGDLLDRGLLVDCPTIPEAKRRTEREFWASFDAAAGRILGAMLSSLGKLRPGRP
jgi:hypothetical protein